MKCRLWAAWVVMSVLVCQSVQSAPPVKSAAKGNSQAPMGSADFYPSAERPVGWRGDGSGSYPGATPPTVWSQTTNGVSKNILWKTKLPCYSWSTPIIVGDKIFTLSEPYDLICLDKMTGKILWIRSHPPFLGVPAEEKRTNTVFQEVEPLIVELQKTNDAFAAQGWTKEIYQKKRELQIKIDELSAKANRRYKLPPDQYVESWAGYTAPTPCSDGKFIYITGGDGITTCYDLNGNRKWAIYESLTPIWGEHGFPSSPTVVGDILLAPSSALRALNKTTGAEIYKQAFGSGYSMLTLRTNGTDFVVASGNYFRAKDGKVLVARTGDMPGGMMTANGDMVYYGGGHESLIKWAAKTNDEISISTLITEEYNRVGLPGGDSPVLKVDPTITGFWTASPLYHDGLLYCLGNFGKLVVADTSKTTKTDAVVYGMFPPFDFKNGYSRKTYGFGIGASPAMAGKYIYMIDSGNCTIVMEPGREYKQVAKNNIDETVPEQSSNAFGEKNYWMGPHQEQTESSLVFEGSRLYIRGEQFLYCIGEK